MQLNKAQIKEAAEMLARAFQDDPLANYVFPEAAERERRLPLFFEVPLRYGLRYGDVSTTSAHLEGVSVWLPSEKTHMSLWRIIASGAVLTGLKLGREAGSRISRLSAYLEAKHKVHVSKRHWYLMVIGVDPVSQGQGYASRLLKPMLAGLDGDSLPSYLETQKEQNVTLYQHFGFNVVEEFTFPSTTLTTWAMLRANSG